MAASSLEMSNFHAYRSQYQPKTPKILRALELIPNLKQANVNQEISTIFTNLCSEEYLKSIKFTPSNIQSQEIRSALRIGVVLSGGQAAGGHNVIVGIYEYIKKRHQNSQLFGFLQGPLGIYTGKYIEINDQIIKYYKNRGGFDMICSGRHKIETEEQFQKSMMYCNSLKLDGLVVVGGDDSNTNACILAEYFLKNNCPTKVIGCPKTIDGDLKNEFVEVSFGFDTACNSYCELIGNIMLDVLSSKKYYHFIRLMGRSASHITLECALLTRPNVTLIGEEVEHLGQTLEQIVDYITNIIISRSNNQKDFGVVLVPEGLIEFINEMKILIKEINTILAAKKDDTVEIYPYVQKQLSENSQKLLDFLPREISSQLLLDRDPHGNVQVAKIETEKLLMTLVEKKLAIAKEQGQYSGKTSFINHYYGYEGRCAFPTNFDCDYCYNLGMNAAILIEQKFTGLMSCVQQLHLTPDNWVLAGYPLVTMMDIEVRKGKKVPVIKKALTELEGENFKLFELERDTWAREDYYRSIGPIQFEIPDRCPYLVRAPNLYELYSENLKTQYDTKNRPYAEIDPRFNMSSLGLNRVFEQTPIPQYLQNGQFRVIQTYHIQNKIPELQAEIEKQLPNLFRESDNVIEIVNDDVTTGHILNLQSRVKIGISLNGRQSPGANGIIEGLLRFTEKFNGELIGFIGGTQGIFEKNYIKITRQQLKYYINQGGYHFLGRTADKIRSHDELEKTKKTFQELKLDGLVLIGATHTLTDALHLSEYFKDQKIYTRVIAVPCTVDNNIGHPLLEGIVGFDSAVKTYAQLIGNILTDAASATKYWYFIRLMGRDPSHLVLECALQTKPNISLIGEEINEKKMSLQDIVNELADGIARRAQDGKNYGTILIPEGLLAHVTQFKDLIDELNEVFQKLKSKKEQGELASQIIQNSEVLKGLLQPWSYAIYQSLPDFTQKQLVLEREVHGSIQLSQIETEKLLSHLVGIELKKRKEKKQYSGSFSAICHFFGYQGRCAFPSLYDCSLATTYGYLSGVLISAGLSGYSVGGRGTTQEVDNWKLCGIPLTSMARKVFKKNVLSIQSHQVQLNQPAFKKFEQNKQKWLLEDHYENSGPVQSYGDMKWEISQTNKLIYGNYLTSLQETEKSCRNIVIHCKYGTNLDLLNIVKDQLQNLERTIALFTAK